jgi:hypothetical protein
MKESYIIPELKSEICENVGKKMRLTHGCEKGTTPM